MARVIKLEKRFERKERRRKINFREQRVYFLIVCEGTKTELQYFESFKTVLSPYTLDIETIGTAKNTLGVVETAIQRRNTPNKKYDSVWAVFDRDSFSECNFNNAIFEYVGWKNNLWFETEIVYL